MKNLKIAFLAATLSLSISANASSVIAMATLDSTDTRQLDCIEKLTNVNYTKAIKDSEGRILVRFVQDNDLISLQVYVEPTKEALGANPNFPKKSFANAGAYIKSKSSDFSMVPFMGVIRDSVLKMPTYVGYILTDRLEYTNSDSLNPAEEDILPIKETTLSLSLNKISFTEIAAYDIAKVGISIPTSTIMAVHPLACTFKRIHK